MSFMRERAIDALTTETMRRRHLRRARGLTAPS